MKTMQFWRVPRFLIMQLKRSQFGKKNTDPIKIPESLNLKDYMTLSSKNSITKLIKAQNIANTTSVE